MTALPTDSKARKDVPITRGVLDYFPAAIAAIARLSKAGNDKHNPGEALHHARGKSTDHADCIVRHLLDRGTIDPEDGIRHSVKVAWRALALLQEELEAEEGATLPRGAREAEDAIDLQKLEDRRLEELAYEVYDGYVTEGFEALEAHEVPVIHSIETEEEAEARHCENNIDQRIAGDDEAAKRIKNLYYRDLRVGRSYDLNDGDPTSYKCNLLCGFTKEGKAILLPWGIPSKYAFVTHPDNLVARDETFDWWACDKPEHRALQAARALEWVAKRD